MFTDESYSGPIELAVAVVQNGELVGSNQPIGGGLSDGPGAQGFLIGEDLIPFEALAGPATVVVSLNYGGQIIRASQAITLQ